MCHSSSVNPSGATVYQVYFPNLVAIAGIVPRPRSISVRISVHACDVRARTCVVCCVYVYNLCAIVLVL